MKYLVVNLAYSILLTCFKKSFSYICFKLNIFSNKSNYYPNVLF